MLSFYHSLSYFFTLSFNVITQIFLWILPRYELTNNDMPLHSHYWNLRILSYLIRILLIFTTRWNYTRSLRALSDIAEPGTRIRKDLGDQMDCIRMKSSEALRMPTVTLLLASLSLWLYNRWSVTQSYKIITSASKGHFLLSVTNPQTQYWQRKLTNLSWNWK